MSPVCKLTCGGAVLLLAGACEQAGGFRSPDAGFFEGPRDERMSFFVTSEGNGAAGGNLGGLAGADARCQRLGGGGRTWRAYLSTTSTNARDRIGTGPWFNYGGVEIASSVDDLHSDPPHYTLIVDETGAPPPAMEHDVLTGSDVNGVAIAGGTCAEWTDGTDGSSGYVGHSNWNTPEGIVTSWSSAHDSPCDEANLRQRWGVARIYCFAID